MKKTTKRSAKLIRWFNSGEPWVWLNASAVSLSLMMVFSLLMMIAYKGLGHFWPADVMQAELWDGDHKSLIIGEIRDHESLPAEQLREAGIPLPSELQQVTRILLKQGNRDVYGLDYRWLLERDIKNKVYPQDLLRIERREWGNLYGRLLAIKENGELISSDNFSEAALFQELQLRLSKVLDLYHQASDLSDGEVSGINYSLEKLRLKEKKLELELQYTARNKALIAQQRQSLLKKFTSIQSKVQHFLKEMDRDSISIRIASGQILEVPLKNILQVIQPNAMGMGQKIQHYGHQIWRFVSENPREANTEGGVFPAIFGTVLMVIIMTILVTPMGVIAAIYLKEYAHQGVTVRVIRIAVNNLAGVPSIVYGVFGLGFFIYFMGGTIDDLFYPEASPAPVFGTPGLLWASITLAILTLPVVIVATEEGLARIPISIREGSMALGATKIETLWHTVLPMIRPAMITGVILAVARAAGEVAPLMLVGVVKLAPTLAVDSHYPFLHLERKFMHLGFHIYDVGFQSPNVEAATPLLYATALLLVLVIILLNLTAIILRNRLRKDYKELEQ